MAALEHEAPNPDALGTVLCVLAAPAGGWVEIVEAHGRSTESDDLVGYFAVHGRDRSLLAPITWPHATQFDLTRFLAGVARMTFRSPQRASFEDPAGGIAIEATALPDIRRDLLVSLTIRASNALTGNPLETELTLHQTALTAIVRSCCARFPGLDVADWHAAWSYAR